MLGDCNIVTDRVILRCFTTVSLPMLEWSLVLLLYFFISRSIGPAMKPFGKETLNLGSVSSVHRMYRICSRYSGMTCHRIVFDDQLRQQFCERLRQPSISVHPRYPVQRVPSTERDSAVLIPLMHFEGCPSIMFTHRSQLLPGHRGEVCFPGGRMERDETHEQVSRT